VNLPSDDHKGRIIGKEGRNIKTLEMLLGVDIIVDETPGVILVSSFNLYRRAIATRVIEILVEDGRIHPGRIEEVHEKVQAEFEQKTYEEGENILIDLGLFPMHEELVKLLGRMKYRASYGQNALAHTLEVARLAKVMAAEMGGDEKLALRAGLLHDIGKALTQDMGGSHVEIGAEICRRHNEHPTVINAIYAHHGHAEPDSVESAAVCAADKLSAARPGARREVLESFTKRVKEVEEIALSKNDVIQAYAINAGREIRVFVNAQKMSDNEAVLLSKEIAKEIQNKVQYPGEIKVNVIRETRSIQYAK
ncbi:MAG: ribonuclease Y, partial [Campylobacterota bacterium]|nr:ribonuclease Y [Campylobacterota bacterium]